MFGGDEKGWVQYDIGDDYRHIVGKARFYFDNPSSGSNTCKVTVSGTTPVSKTWGGECTISQGNHASASYLVCNEIQLKGCPKP